MGHTCIVVNAMHLLQRTEITKADCLKLLEPCIFKRYWRDIAIIDTVTGIYYSLSRVEKNIPSG
jgi:hypothetical protein